MIKYPLNVTIDSNVFDAAKYDLARDSSLSLLVSYVEKHKIKVILSNIIINEILKHIQDKARNIATLVNKLSKDARKDYSESLIKNIGMEHILAKVDREEMARKAKNSLEFFLDKLDIEILDSSTVDAEKIFKDYFGFRPPFEDNDKKRKEFPDAFVAAEIKERFKGSEKVAIISKDVGFKEACGNSSNYLFFDSLGELYDMLNKEEEYYNKALEYIDKFSPSICQEIKDVILENDCVNVIGMSYDKDGIGEGYDYSETFVEQVSDVSCRIHTIDEISDEQVSATLVCMANINVDCYYEDYDNAAWDSESKSYFYLETKRIKEIHKARFGVVVKFDLRSEEFEVSKFAVILGGDSRKDRVEITNNNIPDYEQEIVDMDRENIGLQAMSKYEEFLEDALVDCKMKQDIVSKFATINDFLLSFESMCMVYDEIMEQIKETPEKVKEVMVKMAKSLKSTEKFSFNLDISKVEDGYVTGFLAWIEERYNELAKFADAQSLPDDFEFGDQISFFDANQNTYILALDEINISPSKGGEEYINIRLSNNSSKQIQKGYIKLTVGYLNYDEDGGVADGTEDDVYYCYDEIINEIDYVIEGLKELLDKHNEISKLLRDSF